MTTFLDTNILLAILDPTDTHHSWCVQELANRKAVGPAIVSNIVYAEFSVGMNSRADVDAAINSLALERISEDDDVLFRAGKAFLHYRKTNKGPKNSLMPDFLVGAIAETSGGPLMTANAKDYVGYFPNLIIIKP